ncbi:A24 family peptidase [Amycolatopsis rhabdoformis]|uniref:A24 family peptidase n=1 Tax=Amycolatopsis rhabdoformis TaxID=1448059 RepID=A0ABZ1I9K0_9PSEU|nr:A24 family peptidase [Amycolatopsis rhabdoformis]WSE31092.1 A24 family peptidase [Amycolatopsis rhabdoformis]
MSWGFVVAGAAVVPLLVWLLKKADAPVSVVGAVGLVVGGLVVVAWRWGSGAWAPWWWPVPWLLTVVGGPLSLADVRHRRLPDVLTLPAYPAMAAAVALGALTGGGPAILTDAAAGALVFGGAHLAVHRALPGRMGAGDVKLAGVLGAVLGVLGWASTAFAAVAAAAMSAALGVRLQAAARTPRTAGLGGVARLSAIVESEAPAWSSAPDAPPKPAGPSTPNRPLTPARRPLHHGVPHGPALLLATWICAVFPGAASGVAPS